MKIRAKNDSKEKWLHSHPGKTERDWLLEERCTNSWQRDNLKRLFVRADKNNIPINVCYEVGSYKDYHESYQENFEFDDPGEQKWYADIMGDSVPIHPTIYIESDFQIDRYCYDLDATDSVFEQSIPDLYLNWKANQMGINPLLARTDYEVYKALKPYILNFSFLCTKNPN